MKTCKALFKKSRVDRKDPLLALLDWRNTPSKGIGDDNEPVQESETIDPAVDTNRGTPPQPVPTPRRPNRDGPGTPERVTLPIPMPCRSARDKAVPKWQVDFEL